MMQAHVREKMLDNAPQRRNPENREELRNRPKVIVHVDMDAFFAAVEERDNPALKGLPVIVGGQKNTRGVVTTSNYIAREYGIHAGMSLFEAGRRCPGGIYIRTSGGKYTAVSLQLMQILRRYSPIVEPYSIDEAFLDGTGCSDLMGGAVEYGSRIKRAIRTELHLTASVGMGSSRIVAKIASGLQKPDGLTIIDPDHTAEILGPLPVAKVPGIGPANQKALEKIGVFTVQQLVDCPESLLTHAMGAHGRDLGAMLKGKPGRDRVIALEERPDDKSMGHERTFSTNVTDLKTLHEQLLYLSDRATRRMRKEKYLGRVVTLKLRLHDFKTFDHQRRLEEWTDDPNEIYKASQRLLSDLWKPGDPAVRLIGISVSGLVRPGEPAGVQKNLFNAKQVETKAKLLQAVDLLRDQFGEEIVSIAGGAKKRKY